MTKNTAMKISAFGGAAIAGATGGMVLGPAGVVLGLLGGALVGLPALFHEAPAKKTKTGKRGQVEDDEDPES